MKTISLKFIILCLSISFFTHANLLSASAQDAAQKKSPVIFKVPKGYMPGEFLDYKTGKLLLNAKKAQGMFVVYPNDNESATEFSTKLKAMVAGMFFHDSKAEINWATTPAPTHKGIENETGEMSLAGNDEMEVQLVAYTRIFGQTRVVYGFFAMRHKKKKLSDDGKFLNSAGGGGDFEELWKSLQASE